MNKISPKRIVWLPSLLATLCALALLVACFILPDEMFGHRTPNLFAGIILVGCFLVGYIAKMICRGRQKME